MGATIISFYHPLLKFPNFIFKIVIINLAKLIECNMLNFIFSRFDNCSFVREYYVFLTDINIIVIDFFAIFCFNFISQWTY